MVSFSYEFNSVKSIRVLYFNRFPTISIQHSLFSITFLLLQTDLSIGSHKKNIFLYRLQTINNQKIRTLQTNEWTYHGLKNEIISHNFHEYYQIGQWIFIILVIWYRFCFFNYCSFVQNASYVIELYFSK